MVPFAIDIPQTDIDDLHERLARTRFPNVPDGAEGHGFPLETVRTLVERWQEFDLRRLESRLNELPQLVTEVDGQPVHVIHARSGQPAGALPVVLLHGWADTFYGVHRLIAPLTAAGHDVVVPTLPGYGFSGQPSEPMSASSVAEVIASVVAGLGVERYAVHGGDWGGAVAEQLALTHPERVAAIHLLDVPYHHQFMVEPADAVDDAERAFLDAAHGDWDSKGGYVAIQSTQPLTLAYGLADSPVGLLAWLGEKYEAWCDTAPDPDDVLAQVSLYWFTNTIWSSMRLYAEGMSGWDDGDGHDTSGGDESASGGWGAADGAWSGEEADASGWMPTVQVPAGFALHPQDIGVPPKVFAERFFTDVRRFTLMPQGGHFAAFLEQPGALADEIVTFLRDL